MKIRIQIILLIIFILITTNILFSQNKNWAIVDSIALDNDREFYLGLKCADSLNCMVWVDLGPYIGYMLRRTTDGGLTWKNVYQDTASDPYRLDYINYPRIRDISYPDTNLFIAVGDSGLILRSTDKGETWDRKLYDTNSAYGEITMLDENYGILYGAYGDAMNDSDCIRLVTTDDGISWNKMNWPKEIYFNIHMAIINRNLIYAVADIGKLGTLMARKFITVHDEWKSWDTTSKYDANARSISFANENKGWLGGGKLDNNNLINTTQVIINTEDGGKTWNYQRNQKRNGCGILSIKFFDENYGMATSCMGLCLVTTNGGNVWKETTILYPDLKSPLDFSLSNLQIPSITTAFVTCSGYYIYKYTRDWSDGVLENEPVYGSFTIFPNPAEYYLYINLPPEFLAEKITIYSVEGIEVFSEPSEGFKPSEGYKIDVSRFPPGVYYVKVGIRVCRFIKI